MKRPGLTILLIVSLMSIGYIAIHPYLKTHTITIQTPESTPTASPTIPVTEPNTVAYQNEHYTYSYFIVQHPENLVLIPNFSQKTDAKSVLDANSCSAAVNGGFYDTNNKPLGLFQTGDTTIGRQIESDLMNGYLWAQASASAVVISSELPQVPFRFALQTGPILLFDGNVEPLTIHNDAHARRMVAAKNTDGQLLFMTVYNGESVFEGPYLATLPDILMLISSREKLDLADAINLDGGSASAFYFGTAALTELTPVGSIFCLK